MDNRSIQIFVQLFASPFLVVVVVNGMLVQDQDAELWQFMLDLSKVDLQEVDELIQAHVDFEPKQTSPQLLKKMPNLILLPGSIQKATHTIT